MTFLRKYSLLAVAVVVLFGFNAKDAQAVCSWAGVPNEVALVVVNNTSLDAGHNNLTIGVNGSLSGDRHSTTPECEQESDGPAPFCSWADVAPQTSPANTVSITSGPSGVGGQAITVAVTPGTPGTGCFDPGTETRFNGSRVLNVSALPNGSYNFTVQVTDTFGRSDTANGSFTINRAATHQLSVSKAGTGSGTVTSSPAGISCGSDCSENYTSGTSVTLSQSATTGSTFAGWSGACSGTGSCVVSMTQARSVTATFNSSAGAPTCSGPAQLNTLQNGTFSASGGTGSYTWSTSPNGSPATAGSGSSFTTQWGTSGSKTVTVTSGGQMGTCAVTVNSTAGNCTISVSSNIPTNWLIGGPQVNGQYIQSPGYPTYVSSASYTTDSSGNPLPQGTYGIMTATPSGYTGPTITPSASQNCVDSITFNLEYTPIGDPPPPPPGGAPSCSGPATVALNANATFNGSGGSGSYTWSTTGGNPGTGSGSSFVTKWATLGTKIVNISGGGSGYCTTCVGAFGSCTAVEPPPSCSPGSQVVTTGQTANFSAPSPDPRHTFSWVAAGGTPMTGNGSTFGTVYSTTGTKVARVTSIGGYADCSVTVNPPPVTTGTIIVTSNMPTGWVITGGPTLLEENPSPSTGQTYSNQNTGSYTIIPDSIPNYDVSYVSSQTLSGGGTIVFALTYSEGGPGDGGATLVLTANPSSIYPAGQPTELSWTSTQTTSCTATAGTGFSTGGATSGTDMSGNLYTTEIFSVTCDVDGGGQISDDETVTVPPQCSDGLDNDGDGLIDYPLDPGCDDAQDNDEADDQGGDGPPIVFTECNDGLDNDGDGLIDHWSVTPDGETPDDGCSSPEDDSERYDPDVREI